MSFQIWFQSITEYPPIISSFSGFQARYRIGPNPLVRHAQPFLEVLLMHLMGIYILEAIRIQPLSNIVSRDDAPWSTLGAVILDKIYASILCCVCVLDPRASLSLF